MPIATRLLGRRIARGHRRTDPAAAKVDHCKRANEFHFHVAARRDRRRLHRRQRDGAPHARPRLGGHAAGAGRRLGAVAEGGAGPAAHVALRDVAGLGRGHRLLLQRRLPADAGRQAPAVARTAGAPHLSRDLGRHQGPHRERLSRGRVDLGSRAAAADQPPRLARGDVSHVLVQPAARPRRHGGRHLLRGQRGNGARDQRAPSRHAGHARERARRGQGRERRAARRGARGWAATSATCRSPSPTCSTTRAWPTWPA